MPSLFLSYRRADSPDTVKLIYERLKQRLPRWEIFYDHKSIALGENFPEKLRSDVTSATAVLAFIGPRWLEILGERRSAGSDHVRTEVALALSAGTGVVPVLVGNARMPAEAELAEFPDLLPICHRNGRPVRPDPDFDRDLESIIVFLRQLDSEETVGAILAEKYTLTRELGAGGMGIVYAAQQKHPVKRSVAVKLIKPGMDSRSVLARFDAERQALAVMDHPNIARVLDAGTSASGRPFFVMEYVKGVPITQYCDENKLTPQQRLQLFIPVCNAVQHAHQKGILHRDLKPSNVLVEVIDGKAAPKVIDFGLAKALGHKLTDMTLHTEVDTRVGTLEYSSPEQAAGRSFDVDTRSDIYSLGVLLYELLTGAPPFTHDELLKIGAQEMHRVIREVEPAKPSKKLSSSGQLPAIAAKRHLEPGKLTRLVTGDLDWIVMKCLEKEQVRRYETANQVAQELERFLADEPVQAGPPSAGYRLKKFLRRNKGPVIAAGLVFLALVAGIIGTSIGIIRAEKEADKATKARDFLVSIFQIPPTDIGSGKIMTTREILAQAQSRIPNEFVGQPALRDDVLTAIEHIKRELAKTIPAAMILETRGRPLLHTARGANTPAEPQMLLYPGDRLNLADGATAQLLFLSDLHTEQLRPGKEAAIGLKGCEPDDAVQKRTQDVLMTFVRLRKGTFHMSEGFKGFFETEIKADFEIAVHDVTQGQWQKVMGSNPSEFSRTGGMHNSVVGISDEELKLFPVENVSWDDTQDFLKRLNEQEAGHGYVYRLPTEAEWEYACKGGAHSKKECSYNFYFAEPTNDLSSKQANFDGRYPAGKGEKGKNLGRTTRVGAYPANKLGLCDMHGNVWQWCTEADGPGLIIRGGSWINPGDLCRATQAGRPPRSHRTFDVGFRLVRVPVRPK